MAELHMALIGYSYCSLCHNWLVAVSYKYDSRNVPVSALAFVVTQSYVGPPSIVCVCGFIATFLRMKLQLSSILVAAIGG